MNIVRTAMDRFQEDVHLRACRALVDSLKCEIARSAKVEEDSDGSSSPAFAVGFDVGLDPDSDWESAAAKSMRVVMEMLVEKDG